MNRKPIGLALLLALALGSSPAPAQDETPTAVTNQNRTGDLPFSTSVGTDVEHVDVASGNLIVRIQGTSVPGRGMGYNFALNYDAMLWAVATRKTSGGVTYQKWNIEKRDWLPSGGLGWTINQSRISYVQSQETCGQNALGAPPGTVYKTEAFIYHDSNGGKHPLTIRDEAGDSCNLGTGSYWAGVAEGPDETEEGMWTSFALAPQIMLADGTKDKATAARTLVEYTPGVWKYQTPYGDFLDSNGNKKKEVPGGLDTLGRVIVTRQDLTNQVLYKIYDTNGVLRTYTVNYSNISFLTNFNISGGYGPVQEVFGTRPAISSVVLPNGRSYSFQYETNTYAGLTRVDLPTGAYVTYTWGTYLNGEETHRYVTSRTLHVDGQSFTWNFLRTCSDPPYCDQPQITVTDPQGSQSVYLTRMGKVLSAKFYQGAATGNPVRQHTLDYNIHPSLGQYWLLIGINTTLDDGRVSKKEFDYEYFTYHEEFCPNPVTCGDFGTVPTEIQASRGNVTEIREYEWGAVPATYGQGVPGALVRKTTKSYLHNANAEYLTRNIVSKIIAEAVYDGAGTQKARTEFEYDSTAITSTSGAPQHDYTGYPSTFTYRGNATRVKKWRNTDGVLLTTSYIYDDLGNIRSITDPGLHTTTWDYTDNWSGSGCLPPANSLAYVKQATNHLGHRIQLSRFPCTGAVQSRKDENDLLAGRTGVTFTYDLFGRLLTKVETDGGQTTNAYNDVPPVSATSTSKITSTLNLVSTAIQDSLGRAKQSQLTSDPEGTVFTDTTYDALGRTATASNPYRSTADPTYGITTTQYDALGRVTKVIPPDGTSTTNNITTVYAGPTVTVTDQAGKVRKSETDALGRLIRVWEPNSAGSLVNKTRYFYDTLDNLTCVLQLGTATEPATCTSPSATYRPRTFTYNSLSQLLTAVNPESGTITYTYDSDGNVLTKVAPKPNQTGALTVATTYTYDVLHRLTQKSYNDGATATVKYAYDAAPLTSGCTTYPATLTILNPKGRRTAMCDASGATTWSFDSEGQPLTERRSLDPGTRDIYYTYNLDGSLATVNYTGRVVTYTPSGAGRTLSAVDLGDNVKYVTSALYAPHGGLSSMVSGYVAPTIFNGITTTNSYNNRLQPALLSAAHAGGTVVSFTYGFDQDASPSVVKNNGNVVQIVNNRDNNRTQSFTYDELNRVATAQSQATSGANCWGNSFAYDIWANLLSKTVTKCTAENLSVAVSTSNRITNAGFTYDSGGNMTNSGSGVMTYDAENRLVAAAGVTYTYDGDGKRVKKSSGKLYWTGVGSDPLYETDLAGNNQTEYIYFGGKRVARRDPNGAVFYYFSDHLGSASVVTNATGTIVEESDYYPFGGERIVTNSDPNQYKFTGKERDGESGLDYFIARHYASNLGRFLQPDEFTGGPVDAFSSNDPLPESPLPYADITNPQSLNKYTYTWNNPLRYTDPNGHEEDESTEDGISKQVANELTELNNLGNRAATALENALDGGDREPLIHPTEQPSSPREARVMRVTGVALLVTPSPGGKGKVAGQLHHIATDKAIVTGFTKAFEAIFKKAGMSMQNAANKMFLSGHAGRHSAQYHKYVLQKLSTAVRGLSGEKYKRALLKALKELKKELKKNPKKVKEKA